MDSRIKKGLATDTRIKRFKLPKHGIFISIRVSVAIA